jgi:hypothetical protein
VPPEDLGGPVEDRLLVEAPWAVEVLEPHRGHRFQQRRILLGGDPSRPAGVQPAAGALLGVQGGEPGIKFNALEPGTTATDMTGAFGIGRSPAESAGNVVRPATLGPTGTFTDEFGDLGW